MPTEQVGREGITVREGRGVIAFTFQAADRASAFFLLKATGWCNWPRGLSLMRASTSASQACGSTSLSFAVMMRVAMRVARSGPRSEPAKSQDLRPTAKPGSARSAARWSGRSARRR